MKVIKEGTWKLPWSGEYACKTCEAVLLVEEADVKATDYTYDYHAECAFCTRQIKIPHTDLPLRITDALHGKKSGWKAPRDSWD